MDITTRIIKGGALLEDARRFVDTWDATKAAEENLDRFRAENLLGKRSRSRAEDTLAILRQRFIEPGPQVIPALRRLTVFPDAFREACYFEAARNDDLLAYASGEILNELRGRGWVKVSVEDIERALLDAPPAPTVKEWGDSTRLRVVHGLLSALRDFGVLEGRAIKHIAPPHMTLPGFVYVLGRLREQATSSHAIVTSPVWHWWLLEGRGVRALLLEADRDGLLRFSDAGTILRIDWRVDGLEEMVRAVA
jgi:hypothetical protein